METKFFSLMFSAIALAGAFVSCDDDEESGSGKVSAKSFYDIDGQRVKSVGEWFRCSYKDNGELYTYYYDGDYYQVYLKPFKLIQEGSNSRNVYEIQFNHHGFISSATINFTYDDDNISGKADFTYNNNGQLAIISISEEGINFNEGRSVSWEYQETQTFTYSKSILTSILIKATNTEDGKKKNSTYNIKFEYNTNYNNPFFQYTPNYSEQIFKPLMELEGLAHIGLFGKASSKLPSMIEICEYDGEEEDYEYIACSYSYFQTNGAIKSADGFDYTYTNVGTRAIGEDEPAEYVTIKPEKKHRGIFDKMMRQHSRKQ